MYRAVAVGSHAPFDFPARDGEAPYATDYRYHLQASNTSMWKRSPRQGHRVAEDLRRTLSKNARLAGLITKLQLGINPVFRPDDGSPYVPERDPYFEHEPEWMETNVRILQLCPNVEHVEIRGFEASELDALVNVLKKKSLISFQISSQTLCGNFVEGAQSYSHIFDMMESWPKLRSIKVLSFMSYDALDLITFESSGTVSPRCPDLREIEITGAMLRVREVARMRAMCFGGVTRLSVSYLDVYVYPGAIVALCDCLRAWSSTLEYFAIHFRCERPSSYWPLYEAFDSLMELRELKLGTNLRRMGMGFGSISTLPRLERLHYVSRGEELQTLSRQLEDLKKFPSLNRILLCHESEAEAEVLFELQTICGKRNIRLAERRNCYKYW